jgi:lysophospholipase L1-like esterase
VGNLTLVLLGDSILDNARYTTPEPDTASLLRGLLGEEWSVHLLAQDGAAMRDIGPQIRRFEVRPAVGVLSVGGNDAMEHAGLLQRPAKTAADVLEELLQVADDFGRRYESVVRAVTERIPRTVLCTIYEARLEPARHARLARVPLAVLNDRIIRTGMRFGLDVIDLRTVCTEAQDFVLQIEPSARGAAKIAAAITGIVLSEEGLTSGRVFSAHG